MSVSVEQLPQSVQTLTPPLHRDGSRKVESTYAHRPSILDTLMLYPRGQRPDYLTHWRHTWHLHRRRKEKKPRQDGMVMLVDHEVPTTVRKFDGIYPLRSIAATIAASIILYPIYHPSIEVGTTRPAVPAHVKVIEEPGQPELVRDKSVKVTVLFGTGNASAVGEEAAARGFVLQMKQDITQGEIPIDGKIVSRSSPDYKEYGSATVTRSGLDNPDNLTLSGKRGNGLLTSITTIAQQEDVTLPEISVESEVKGLTKSQIEEINRSLAKYGETLAGNFNDLLPEYDTNPQSLEPDVREAFDAVIGKARSATATVDMGHVVVPEVAHIINIPGTPGSQKHKVGIPILFPIIWPKTRKEEGSENIRTPEVVGRDLPNPRWLWLYPEVWATPAENTFKENTVLYSRLMHIFMRDDRISRVLKHQYVDDADQKQTIRSLFIDHEPSDGAVEYVKRFMTTLSYALGGKVGDYLDIVGVFPKETAGRSVKEAGLGLDNQEDPDVVGVAYPAVRYAEILAPKNPTKKDFANINTFVGTIVHELKGHYGDRNNEDIIVTPINRRKNTYTTPNLMEGVAASVFDRFPDPTSMDPKDLQFEITIVEPGKGEVTYWVDGTDQRLSIARTAILQNAAPTGYSASSHYELFAEIARQVGSGLLFPFESAGLMVPEPELKIPGIYAGGYAAADELRELVAKRLGATTRGMGLAWPEESVRKRLLTQTFFLTDVLGDDVMREMSEYARNRPQPRKTKMPKVLMGSSGVEKVEMAA